MESIENTSTEDSTKETAKNETNDTPETETTSPQFPSFLARQYPISEGGMQTDMDCPNCEEEISGSYLPVFKCPHCESQIWRDNNGDVTHCEQNGANLELSEETKQLIRKYMQRAKTLLGGFEVFVDKMLQDKRIG